jgi:hypothetical protein
MGRGAYDTTDPSMAESAIAGAAVDDHHASQERAAVHHWGTSGYGDRANKSKQEAEVKAAAENELKLIRSKKSRGIMVCLQHPAESHYVTNLQCTGGKKGDTRAE